MEQMIGDMTSVSGRLFPNYWRLTMERFQRFWLNCLPFIFGFVLFLFGPTACISQTQNRPAQQPKPTIRVLTLGHDNHGKSTLTAAITKVLYKTGRAKFVPYEDLENPPEIEVQGVKFVGAMVEYETDKARYEHIDGRSNSDYQKLLAPGGVALGGAILVVSAEDGPMPQTREHLILASKKGIKSIVVYLNKVDLAKDPELVALVELETRELLTACGFNGKEAPIIRGSALMALVGTKNEIGGNTIIELLNAMDKHFAENTTERRR